MPTSSEEYPEQRKRMKALQTARSEMVKVIARQRLASALRLNVPAATDRDIAIGSDALLYKERPRNEWLGPYKVLVGNNKNLLINDDGRTTPVSIDKFKPYKRSSISEARSTSLRDINAQMDQMIFREAFLSHSERGWQYSKKECLYSITMSPQFHLTYWFLR